MRHNLEIRWSKHALNRLVDRKIDFRSAREVAENPLLIEPGNKNLREIFIGIGQVDGGTYTIALPVSAGYDGRNGWLMVKSAIPKRKYKDRVEK